MNEAQMDLKDITSKIDELTVKNSNKFHEDVPHFTGYHIYVQAGCEIDRIDSKDYEMKLYEEYVNREGEMGCTLSSDSKSKNKRRALRNMKKLD